MWHVQSRLGCAKGTESLSASMHYPLCKNRDKRKHLRPYIIPQTNEPGPHQLIAAKTQPAQSNEQTTTMPFVNSLINAMCKIAYKRRLLDGAKGV